MLGGPRLVVGFGLLGMTSVFGYLNGAGQNIRLSAVQIAGVFGTKVLSVAALIAWGWVLSRCVRRVSSLGMQVSIYGIAWMVSIIFASTIVALASGTDPNSWFVGVSDIYQGLPTYINAIPIIIDHTPRTATVTSILLNFATVLTAIGCEICRRHPRRQ